MKKLVKWRSKLLIIKEIKKFGKLKKKDEELLDKKILN